MYPLGCAGSSPALGTFLDSATQVAKLVDAQSSGGCALGRAGSSPVLGTINGAVDRSFLYLLFRILFHFHCSLTPLQCSLPLSFVPSLQW